jgi:hypothetical protein
MLALKRGDCQGSLRTINGIGNASPNAVWSERIFKPCIAAEPLAPLIKRIVLQGTVSTNAYAKMIAVGAAENWDIEHVSLPFNLVAVTVRGNEDPIDVLSRPYLA